MRISLEFLLLLLKSEFTTTFRSSSSQGLIVKGKFEFHYKAGTFINYFFNTV